MGTQSPSHGELVFLKLGGSLLTDKTQPQAVRAEVLARLAREVASALAGRPELRLVIGHGSGSFGHFAAQKYGTRSGVRAPEEWRGYAETSLAAARLNRLVVDALWKAGVPALALQPSASAWCEDGNLLDLAGRPILIALEHGLAPVVYGDVALDSRLGGTIISTEQIFAWLAPRLKPDRIVLAGEVEGVFSADPERDPAARLLGEVTPDMVGELGSSLGGSRGVDVTGGMLTKVTQMLALVEQRPGLVVQIVSGLAPGLVRSALSEPAGVRLGTLLHADSSRGGPSVAARSPGAES